MELEGRIIAVLPSENGTSAKGKNWTKNEFVIETEGQYPKKVAIVNFNEKVPSSQLTIGAKVKAHINIESRESNGKWYTSVNIWKLELLESVNPVTTNQSSTQATAPSATNDLPF